MEYAGHNKLRRSLMTDFETYYLALVIGAMVVFGGTLALTSWWSSHRPPR